MDIYKEYMIKQKRSPLSLVGSVCLWLLAVAFTPLAFTLSIVTYGLSVPLGFGFYVLAWWFTRNSSIEYEYIFTNGELDVDRISGRRARKRFVTIQVSKFDICAKAQGEQLQKFLNDPAIRITFDASKGPGTDGRYFAVFTNKDGQKMLMFFSPPSALLEYIKTYNPLRTVTD